MSFKVFSPLAASGRCYHLFGRCKPRMSEQEYRNVRDWVIDGARGADRQVNPKRYFVAARRRDTE